MKFDADEVVAALVALADESTAASARAKGTGRDGGIRVHPPRSMRAL